MRSCRIPLSNSPLSAIVDWCDKVKVAAFNWWIMDGYATSGYYIGNRKAGRRWVTVRMARLIMDAPKGVKIDHRDQNKLNNRRANLRGSTNAQNSRNMRQCARKTEASKSVFKGVSWDKIRTRWTASIMFNYRRVFLGRFEHEILAAVAYNDAAVKYFGEFASLNNISASELKSAQRHTQPPIDRRSLLRRLSQKQETRAKQLRLSGISYSRITEELGLAARCDQSVRAAVLRKT